jgi:hypothetical protein
LVRLADLKAESGDLAVRRPAKNSRTVIVDGPPIILDVPSAFANQALAREAAVDAFEFYN